MIDDPVLAERVLAEAARQGIDLRFAGTVLHVAVLPSHPPRGDPFLEAAIPREVRRVRREYPVLLEGPLVERQPTLPLRNGLPRMCEVPGCGRARKGRRWCDGHLWRLRHRGDLLLDVPISQSHPGGRLPGGS